ncbi:MAG: DUF1844 domain-containing protein [Polyangia bacterium]|nr:DUF1844 domain-containing protein [Polyangia bacterium]
MTQGKDDQIKVRDRRTAGGEASDAPGEPKPSTQEERDNQERVYSEVAGSCEEPEDPGRVLPPVDFSTLVISFAQSALVHLGELTHPEIGKPTRDLTLARHNIDLLGMLQDKTRGNLDTEEQKLIENLLYDLRMKYVSQCRSA